MSAAATGGAGRWRFSGQNLGLIMIALSLLVLALLVMLYSAEERDNRAQAIRAQGLSVSRVLGGMNTDQLAPDSGNVGLLEIVGPSLKGQDFAYVAVVTPDGRVLRQVTNDGVIVPGAPLNLPAAQWFGERQLRDPAANKTLIEFHAPMIGEDGELGGFVRLAYYDPSLGLTGQQLRFVATMILPVFLLVPLFYFPLQRQLRSITEANQSIRHAMDQGDFSTMELRAEGELAEFINGFNTLATHMREQINQVQQERDNVSLSATLLEYRRERTETVLQSIPYGIIALDESGKITMVNKRTLSIFNRHEDDVLEQPATMLSDDTEVQEYLQQYDLQSGSGQYNRAMTFESEFMPDKTLQIDALPLLDLDLDNTVSGSLLLIRDVTQERLSLQNRSEFVANIAHELKTPLNTLSLYSEALLDRGDSAEFRDEATNIIIDEVHRLSTLINNMLRLTKFEMGVMELQRSNIRLLDLLNDAIKNAIPRAAQKDIRIETDLPNTMSSIHADKEMLRIVLTNLIGNAIKYSDEGDEVTVSASEDDDSIEIRVADTGIGIADDELPFIFDKHFRSQSSEAQERTGHGLGLPLAQEIIALHHGKLTATSEHGTGSEFVIRFDKSTGILAQAL